MVARSFALTNNQNPQRIQVSFALAKSALHLYKQSQEGPKATKFADSRVWIVMIYFFGYRSNGKYLIFTPPDLSCVPLSGEGKSGWGRQK
jgi:hypothetical protein